LIFLYQDSMKINSSNLDAKTKNLIIDNLAAPLATALEHVEAVLKKEKLSIDDVVPPPDFMFRAFELCPVDSIRIVLIGQDPYLKKGVATGLSFGVSPGSDIPQSLKNIFKCLQAQNIAENSSGDLEYWARQGVLLLNTALTTAGESAAHCACWEPYTNAVIKTLAEYCKDIIFILLGAHAGKRAYLCGDHTILTWGHPSPLNRENRDQGPRSFINCDVFKGSNDVLVSKNMFPIDWRTKGFPLLAGVCEKDPSPPELGDLWVFTDGGAIANGKPNCKASWAFYITDGISSISSNGLVVPSPINGKVYQTSNNRGELTAIYEAIRTISLYLMDLYCENINIISDSRYCIQSIIEWAPKWKEKGLSKKNTDLIYTICNEVNRLEKRVPIKFYHINSHKTEPGDQDSWEWFKWMGNTITDKMCTELL
jgi:uracil-DNA glycosylase